MDGYDKLKPYGFCVHGAIDGYVFWWLIKSSFHREGHKSKGLKSKKKKRILWLKQLTRLTFCIFSLLSSSCIFSLGVKASLTDNFTAFTFQQLAFVILSLLFRLLVIKMSALIYSEHFYWHSGIWSLSTDTPVAYCGWRSPVRTTIQLRLQSITLTVFIKLEVPCTCGVYFLHTLSVRHILIPKLNLSLTQGLPAS